MRKWLPALFILISTGSFAQFSEGYKELRNYSKKKEVLPGDTRLYLENFYTNGFHYLYPLYKAFFQEQKLLKADTSLYYDQLCQAVAFTGDYASTLELEKLSFEKLSDSTKLEINQLTDLAKEVTYTDARKYILGQTKNNKVVMINEAHDKPLHRVFTASLLEELYQQGFHYLAMEMLDHFAAKAITKPTVFTGYYSAEPVAGELIRKALEIGYTLISYEDTISSHTTTQQREYSQAENLYNTIKKLDKSAKILVHAGYVHIQEAAKPDTRIPIPMAAYFKIISGIDPLTIDQTEMSENGKDAYTGMFYDKWRQKNPFNNSVVAIKNDKTIDPYGLYFYDIHVIHPPTIYRNNRPTWMNMNGWKKETPVNPAFKSLFLVQAYYEKEYNEKTVSQAVPADQTYNNASNGLYYLYLRKGLYKLLFRDKEYKILGVKDLAVD